MARCDLKFDVILRGLEEQGKTLFTFRPNPSQRSVEVIRDDLLILTILVSDYGEVEIASHSPRLVTAGVFHELTQAAILVNQLIRRVA